MLIPAHRNPSSPSAPHLTPLGNPRLSPISNPALSPISNPALSPLSNPALSPISNPRLSPISNPALSKISNPALSAISNPRLSPFQNPRAKRTLPPAWTDSIFSIPGTSWTAMRYSLLMTLRLFMTYLEMRSGLRCSQIATTGSSCHLMVVPRSSSGGSCKRRHSCDFEIVRLLHWLRSTCPIRCPAVRSYVRATTWRSYDAHGFGFETIDADNSTAPADERFAGRRGVCGSRAAAFRMFDQDSTPAHWKAAADRAKRLAANLAIAIDGLADRAKNETGLSMSDVRRQVGALCLWPGGSTVRAGALERVRGIANAYKHQNLSDPNLPISSDRDVLVVGLGYGKDGYGVGKPSGIEVFWLQKRMVNPGNSSVMRRLPSPHGFISSERGALPSRAIRSACSICNCIREQARGQTQALAAHAKRWANVSWIGFARNSRHIRLTALGRLQTLKVWRRHYFKRWRLGSADTSHILPALPLWGRPTGSARRGGSASLRVGRRSAGAEPRRPQRVRRVRPSPAEGPPARGYAEIAGGSSAGDLEAR